VAASTGYGQDFFRDMNYYGGLEIGGSLGSGDVSTDVSVPDWDYGYSTSGDDDDAALFGGAKIGIESGKWRSDLSFVYRDELSFDSDGFRNTGASADFTTNVDARTLMVSAYYDVFDISEVSIFVGGGVGAAFLRHDTSNGEVSGSENDTNFAWQVGFGADYDITYDVSIEGGYRYIDMGDGSGTMSVVGTPSASAGKYDFDLSAHELYLGVRWRF